LGVGPFCLHRLLVLCVIYYSKNAHLLLNYGEYFMQGFFFPFQFCDVATLANCPQEELAKFGYRSERKVK
jgi:hypothetical protein